jgi:hypothetical protein
LATTIAAGSVRPPRSRAPALDDDLLRLRRQLERAAERGEQLDQRAHDGAGAAAREPHAPFALEVGNERVDRRGGERIAADQQRMERQHHAQRLVADVLAHELPHRQVRAQPDHRRHDLEHVARARERDVAELLESDGEDLLRLAHEPSVAVDVAGGEARHFGVHALGIAGVVEHAAVGKTDAVERVDRHQLEVLLHLASGEREQLLEQKRRGDDGGPAVEREPGVAIDVGAPAGGVALVDHGDGKSARLQANGRGQPAEAGADDHHARRG